MTSSAKPPQTSHLLVQLSALTVARLFLNTGLRMVYPFLPAIARGVGVEITAVYRLVTLRNFAGLLSPLFGPLIERYGRKPLMIAAIILFAAGSLIVVIWPAYWSLGVTLVLIGIAKVIFDPAMQSYIGDLVPYSRRGRALAVTELAWSGALLLGAPLIGLAIQVGGWQSPFLWLGMLAAASAVLLWQAIPRIRASALPPALAPALAPASAPASAAAPRLLTLGDTARTLRRHPVIWAAAFYALLATSANEIFFIVYGDWMEGSFGLALGALGLASAVIGGSEIVGEISAGLLVDHFGKRRVIITTGLLNALAYLAIPFTGVSLVSALVSLALLFWFFEVTLVGGVPLLTELVPTARSVVMSVVLAAAALGRGVGSLVGPIVFQRAGLTGSGLTAAVVMLLAMLVLARWVREADAGR